MESFPLLAVDLADALDGAFPSVPQSSLARMSPAEVQFYAGQRSVIEFIRMRQKQLLEG